MTTVKLNLPKAWAKQVVLPAAEDASTALIPHPTVATTFESAGEWIQKSLWAAMVKKQLDSDKSKSKDQGGSPTSKGPTARERRRTGGVKMNDEDLAEDWYNVLKLEEGTTDLDTIRTAYRKRCLETHPDKQPNHSDVEFKKVQKAFDILSDEDTRRAYDSSRLFDDSIPPETVAEVKFFSSFGPVFDRNKRWSVDTGLPSLGDDNTPIAEVKKFYDAWYRYRSWRDFSAQCELEEIHESMERMEKRFYQRENQRQLDKCMKEEIKRIRDLVDRAHNNDPRIRKEREAEAAAIEKAKQERVAERERAREEVERARREEADRKVREEEEKKNKIKMEKDRSKEYRDALVGWFKSNNLLDTIPSNKLLDNEVRQVNINWLSQKSSADHMEQVLQEVVQADAEEKDGKVEAVLKFNAIIERKEADIGVTRYGEACKTTKQKAAEEEARKKAEEEAAAKNKKKKSGVDWNDEDLVLLTKAIAKFPGGTVDRWRRINTMLEPGKFSEEDILQKTKEIESGWKTGSGDASSIKKQTAPTLGGVTVNKDGDASAEAWGSKHELGNPFKPRLIRMLQKYTPDKVEMADAMLTKYAGKEEDFIQALVRKFGPEPPAPAAAPAPKKQHVDPVETESVEEWTAKQQKQLEDSLRDFKDYKEKDKYVKVAAKVEGKTAKQCFERFKYLVALNKKR